jgi:hypothetical protein
VSPEYEDKILFLEVHLNPEKGKNLKQTLRAIVKKK